MAALGTAANLFGVVTPAKDVVEVIKAITDSIEKAKRSKFKTSTLIKALNIQVERVDSAILLCKHATEEQLKSLAGLKISLKFILAELQELDQNRRQLSSYFIRRAEELWNSGDILTRIEQLEFELKQCHDLFAVDSLTRIEHAGNIHTSMLMRNEQTVDINTSILISMQTRLGNISSNIIQLAQGGGLYNSGQRSRFERTTIWKTPMKADFSNPKVIDYVHLSNKLSVLLEHVKSNSGRIELSLLNNMGDFLNTPSVSVLQPIGGPTRECEDASGKAIQLSRVIQKQNLHISAEWFDDLCKLAFIVHDVGFRKEALQIREFEYHMLTVFTSEQGSNVDSCLARNLHNMAISYFDEGRYDEAVSLLERAVGIYRRLGESFIPNLADSLRVLSKCLCNLGQYKEAAKFLQESIVLYQELVSINPLQYDLEMARCLTSKAFLHVNLREHQKAIHYSQEAIQYLSKSSPRFKEEVPSYYADIQWIAALAYRDLGDIEKAEEYGREATKVSNRLINDRPLYYLANSKTTQLSNWFRETGRSQDAIYILEESLTVYCSVVPSPAVQKKFADTLYCRAEIQHSSGNFNDALDALSRVIETRRQLLEDDEVDFSSLVDQLSAFNLRSSCLISLHRQNEAIKSIETALDILRSSLAKVELSESQIGSILQVLIFQESMLQRMDCEAVNDLREFKKSLLFIDEASLVFRQRMFDGEHSHCQSKLAWLLELRYLILFQMRKFSVAIMSIQEAVDLYHHIVNKNGDIKSQIDLIRVLHYQAHCQNDMQCLDSALATLDEALKHIHSISGNKRSGKFLDFFLDVLYFHDSLIGSLIGLGEYSKAFDAMNTSIEIVHSFKIEDSSRAQALLGRIFIRRSICCYELGRFREAFSDAKKAVEIHRRLVAENIVEHSSNLARSLYEHAISSFALDDTIVALNSIKEAVDIDAQTNGVPSILSLKLHAKILCSLALATDGDVDWTGAPDSQSHCLNGMQRIDYVSVSFQEILQHLSLISAKEQSVILIEDITNIFIFYNRFIDSLNRQKKYSKALDSMNKSIEVIRSLKIESSSRAQALLGRIFIRRSTCCFELGSFEEAGEYAKEGVEIYRRLVAENAVEHEWNLAWSLSELARSSFALNDITGALNSIKEAVDIEARTDGVPSIFSLELYAEILCNLALATDGLVDLTGAPDSQSHCLNGMQRIDYVLVSFQEILEHLRLIWDKEQCVISIEDIAYILHYYNRFIDSLILRKEYSKPLDSMNKSIEVIHSLKIESSSRAQALLGRIFIRRSTCCFELGSFEEAGEYAKEGVEIYRRLVAENAVEHEWNLAWSLLEHAKSSLALHILDEALISIDEAVDINSRIELKEPHEIQDNLIESITLRAEILYRLGRAADVQHALSETWVLEINGKSASEIKEVQSQNDSVEVVKVG